MATSTARSPHPPVTPRRRSLDVALVAERSRRSRNSDLHSQLRSPGWSVRPASVRLGGPTRRGTARRGRGPGPPSRRAASVRCGGGRRPVAVVVQPARSRGHSRISASWATSTVGSRVTGSRSNASSRAAPNRSMTAAVAGVGRRSSERAHPPPGVLGALAERDEPAEQPARRRLLGSAAPPSYSSSARRASAPASAAELLVGRQRQQPRRPAARTARSARTAAAAARRAGRRRRRRSRHQAGSNSQPTRCRRVDDRPLQLVGRQRRHRDRRRLDQRGELAGSAAAGRRSRPAA